jgi:perosamine synthetase
MAAVRSDLADDIIAAIRSVVGTQPVALHEPQFAGNEWTYLKECLDSTYVSSVGKFVDRFEAALAEYTGARHAVAVMNGTAALQVAMLLAGVQPEEEVLIPALTFVATACAVRYCGAVPHFVDSEQRTLGVDVAALRLYLGSIADIRGGNCVNRRTGRVIRALVPMHVFGHPMDIEAAAGLAREFCLTLIEDAAESLGSTVDGRHTGTFGLMGTLSFNGNKTVTTGGGGAILTDDTAIAQRAKHLTTTAKVPHRWEFQHDEVGYNYRMPNLNAALGCAQLEELDGFVASKRRLFELYRGAFARVAGVQLMSEPAGVRSNYWLQTLILDEAAAGQRDWILEATNDAGLMTRPLWTLLHRLKPYQSFPRMDLSVAEGVARRIVNIPSSSRLAGASSS